MRFVCLLSAALGATLLMAGDAAGQAGRYIPLPRLPGAGGGVGRGWHIPYLPLHPTDHAGSSDVFWVFLVIVCAVVLLIVGWKLGQVLRGRGTASCSDVPKSPQDTSSSAPPLEDLIWSPAEVQDKAHLTSRLTGSPGPLRRPL
jgi:hypothetical protein